MRNILQDGIQAESKLFIRLCSSDAKSGAGRVAIGDVSIATQEAVAKELVPVLYIPEKPPQSILHHLKWIMQKDALGQDVFLIGTRIKGALLPLCPWLVPDKTWFEMNRDCIGSNIMALTVFMISYILADVLLVI